MEIPRDWTFDNSNIAEGFDRHVREQLPWYDLLTAAIAHIVRHYLPVNGLVYDIGSSTGNIGRAIENTVLDRNARLIAIEKSESMCSVYTGPGECINCDALDFEFEDYDVCICFLVIMFMPTFRRKIWLRNLASRIKPGGALIVADKTADHMGYLSTVMHRLTIAGKASAGIDAREIVSKELSLSGIQRPITSSMMDYIAPRPAEVFRFGEFACWVCERPE